MAPDLPELLTREVGPLPVWGWGVGIIGGFFLSRRLGGLFGSSSTEDDTAADTDNTPGYVSAANAGGYFAPRGGTVGGTITSYPNVGPTPTNGGAATDNDDWRDRAIRLLREQGYGALTVDQALTRWLAGQNLTGEQGAIVDAAIVVAGFPPFPPTQTGSIIPDDPPAPPAPEPAVDPPAAAAPGPSKPRAPQQITPAAPSPSLPANHLPGERFVDFANAAGGGTWWLTNWGGVYAVGGAPYHGNPIQDRVAPDLAGQTFVAIEPIGDGRGYMVHDNHAGTGSYHYQ